MFFGESAELIKKMVDEIKKDNQKEKEKLIEAQKPAAPVRVVKIEQDEKTKARLSAIKDANDLYERFQVDFMRDLEKQYSLSTKDMYETFVNVKFKKFVERFNMPLDSGISVGQAKEAYAQIRNLMDYISKISENAYTTSVYSEK